MRQLRTPLLGLILAIAFGVRVGSAPLATAPPSAASFSAKVGQSKKKKPAVDFHAASAPERTSPSSRKPNGCTTFAVDSKTCLPALPPYWKALCALNPDHRDDRDLPETLPSVESRSDFAGRCLGNEKGKILFVLASVPDPVHTHLGLTFDRVVDAIQVAASQDSFLPYSHYLPWPDPEHPVPADAEVTVSSEPGLLILRQAEGTGRFEYLVVFLVSDVPTRGLSREAFLDAKNAIDMLSPDQKTIWLAGPSFSGSVASLADLANHLDVASCIQAFSGSVTNPPKDLPAETGHCKPQLHLFQTKEPLAMKEFVAGIKSFGYKPEQIALLSEEGTKYGNLGSPAKQDSTQPATQPTEDDGLSGILLFSFPREISKLRNAYAAEASQPSDDGTAQGLPIQWQDTKSPQTDDLPDYGPQTPNSQQAVLANISTALRVHGIKVLGIIATNPLDTAFLLRSLKQSAHDVRFILRDPDLLYLRTPDIGTLNGTLLLSNYPLIPENQDWSSGESELPSSSEHEPDTDHLVTFASASQEGEYNAFIALLEKALAAFGQTAKFRRLEWNWPSGTPVSEKSLVGPEGKAPCSSQPDSGDPMPPLWLATIGTAGHFPLAILCQDLSVQSKLHLDSLPVGKPLYTPWLLWLLVTVTGILHLCGLASHKYLPGRYRYDFQLTDHTELSSLKGSCHLVAILCIALAEWVLGSGYIFFRNPVHGGNDTSFAYRMLFWSVLVVTAALLVCAVYIAERLYSHHKVVAGALVPVIIFVGAGIWWSWSVLPETLQNAFLHYRDLNLTSGVAPALPLAFLILVFYLGIWAFLRRLAYWRYRYAAFRSLPLDDFVNCDFTPSTQAIDRCMQGRFKSSSWTFAFWAAFISCVVMYRPWLFPMDMLEPRGVRLLITAFVCLVLLALWLNWFRFLSVWLSLQEVLNRLESLPIKSGFNRLPHENSLPIWQWRSSDSCFLLRQIVDRLRALEKSGSAIVSGTAQTFNAWIASQPYLDAVKEDEKEAHVKTVVDVLVPWLKANYWNGQSPGKAGLVAQPAPAPDEKALLLAEDIIVLPFYDYIRHVVIELRNLLFFVVAAFCLLFGALHVYAFGADTAIDWSMIALFVVLGTGVVTVLAQMARNPLLRRLTDGTGGGLGKSFYFDLLKYGTVPLLTVLGSQVPFISNNVLRWLQPAVEALR